MALNPRASLRGFSIGLKIMLWAIIAALIILWVIGWGFHVAGNLIHALLVLALIMAMINFAMGRRTV
ncbi:MAG: lmo0937 family membrane protein [Terriglobales bacterium]